MQRFQFLVSAIDWKYSEDVEWKIMVEQEAMVSQMAGDFIASLSKNLSSHRCLL